MAITGIDDRWMIPDYLLTHRPYSAIVQITAKFPNNKIYTGSGAMIGPDDVLTAAHVVYSEEDGGWATDVAVSPAVSPSAYTYGYSLEENIISVAGWTRDQSFDWDYAYIDLSSNLGFQTGWLDIGSRASVGSQVESLGYPGDLGHYQMVHTMGTIDYVGTNVFQFYDDLDLMPGQSGSPLIYTNPSTGEIDIVGIVSHHQYFPSTMNGALRLTNAMVNQINGWAINSENDPGGVSISFDEAWYLSKYQDIGAAVSAGVLISGEDHFYNYGWLEGRDPCADFDTSLYLALNPDVEAAGCNPFSHFLQNGQYEGRPTAIDVSDYLLRYQDVMHFNGGAKMHYELFGRFEGRTAKGISDYDRGYNPDEYLIDNISDVLNDEVNLAGVNLGSDQAVVFS